MMQLQIKSKHSRLVTAIPNDQGIFLDKIN